MESYITVKDVGEYRFEDRKSVFWGYAVPINCENDALEFIAAVKKKYSDARHWVYAYVLRENSTMRYTDDGEPQGTAGMPVLDIIRKNGCTNTLIIVVRYFGGVLLGTGGLVHAYTECALGALKAATVIRYDVYSSISLKLSYSDYQKVSSIFNEYCFQTENTEYSDCVFVFGSLLKENCDIFCSKLKEATSGRVEFHILSEKFDFRENI